MILIGHPLIPSERFYHIDSIEAISHTPPNSLIALFYDEKNLDIVDHLRRNKIRFGLYVTSCVEAVIAENLRANYLIVHPKHAEPIQSVAEHYLFDAKVLGYIEEISHLSKLIEMRLDGALFTEAIVKITS